MFKSLPSSAAQTGSAACLQAFETLSGKLQGPDECLISSLDLEDELGRFRIWAANIGAFQKGHSSLDYRLHEAPLVHSNIVKRLKELYDNLIEISNVLQGKRLPYEQQARLTLQDEDTESINSSHGSSDSADEESDPDQATAELEQRFSEVIDIVDTLYKLSRAIRNPQLRLAKASAHKHVDKETGIDLVQRYSKFDYDHTKEVVAQLRKDVLGTEQAGKIWSAQDEELLKRLSDGITKRRQQFLYWRSHRDKLGHWLTIGDFTATDALPAMQTVTEPDKTAHSTIESPTEDLLRLSERIALTETTATVFMLKDYQDKLEAPSLTSYATTAKGLDGSRVDLPPPPNLKLTNKDFECPYCFVICPARYLNPKAWRTHLLRDLRPYACTYPDCHQGEQLFISRSEWINHERTHQQKWVCPEHSSEQWHSSHELETHLAISHESALSQTSRSMLLDYSKSPNEIRSACPICLVDLTETANGPNHIANHLERLAAFAVPHSTAVDEEASTDLAGSVELNPGLSQDERSRISKPEADNVIDREEFFRNLSSIYSTIRKSFQPGLGAQPEPKEVKELREALMWIAEICLAIDNAYSSTPALKPGDFQLPMEFFRELRFQVEQARFQLHIVQSRENATKSMVEYAVEKIAEIVAKIIAHRDTIMTRLKWLPGRYPWEEITEICLLKISLLAATGNTESGDSLNEKPAEDPSKPERSEIINTPLENIFGKGVENSSGDNFRLRSGSGSQNGSENDSGGRESESGDHRTTKDPAAKEDVIMASPEDVTKLVDLATCIVEELNDVAKLYQGKSDKVEDIATLLTLILRIEVEIHKAYSQDTQEVVEIVAIENNCIQRIYRALNLLYKKLMRRLEPSRWDFAKDIKRLVKVSQGLVTSLVLTMRFADSMNEQSRFAGQESMTAQSAPHKEERQSPMGLMDIERSWIFRWEHAANEVYVTGTFDDWSKSEKLTKLENGCFEKVVYLGDSSDYVFYKFVVDGHWAINHTLPTGQDAFGNFCNVVTQAMIDHRQQLIQDIDHKPIS